MTTTSTATLNTATGPKTPAGKAISARNATTHGLFCRQTVLPHLGEDPQAYKALLDALTEQLRPCNLMEHQYLELWADASWKLRRLSRLEAQTWEADCEDETLLLAKLERLARLTASLRRQLDKAVRMLLRDVPGLYARRTREDVLAGLNLTESLCRTNICRELQVEQSVQGNRRWPSPPDDLRPRLDNAADLPVPAPAPVEPPHPRPSEGEGRSPATGEMGSAAGQHETCQHEISQNEPASATTNPLPQGEVAVGATRRGCPGETEGFAETTTTKNAETNPRRPANPFPYPARGDALA